MRYQSYDPLDRSRVTPPPVVVFDAIALADRDGSPDVIVAAAASAIESGFWAVRFQRFYRPTHRVYSAIVTTRLSAG